MSFHRFFITSPLPSSACDGWTVPLRDRDLHHLSHVLRLKSGDRVVLAGPDGREAEATLESVSAAAITANLEAPRERPAGPRVVLAQGLTRRERMELAIQKATEVGVSEVVPVAFARSVVKLDEGRADARIERWQRVAEEAAKQSQRALIPVVRSSTDLTGLLVLAEGFDVVLVPWEEAADSAPGIGEALAAAGATSASSVLVVIGPEGGLEVGEVAALERAGALRVSLGDTILRTETAAVVATSLVLYELGGLGGRAC